MTDAYRALAGRIRRDLDDGREMSERAEAIWHRFQETGTPTTWMPLP